MRIDERYSGLPRHALGGYVAGLLARMLAARGAIEVRLERPVLVGDDVHIEGDTLMRGDERVATAREVVFDLRPPRIVGPDEAEVASASYPGRRNHFFPECFCCGPARRRGDGLRIFPSPANGVMAATWRPGDAIDDVSVPLEIVWAALDCPGIWAQVFATTGSSERAVTGSLAVATIAPISSRDTLVVTGWPIRRDGRKIHVGSAISDERGTLLAVADQTLIVTDSGVPLDRAAWEAAPRPPDRHRHAP